jgi:hypothetical protein
MHFVLAALAVWAAWVEPGLLRIGSTKAASRYLNRPNATVACPY